MGTSSPKQILEIAIAIAVNAHRGQMDKGGMPYILHPLHVMDQCEDIGDKIVAVLHDVPEDTKIKFDFLLANGIPDEYVDDVKRLTHDDPSIPYEDYIDNIKTSARATRVKLKDIEHNSDITRMHIIEEKHLKMIKKYHWARRRLLNLE